MVLISLLAPLPTLYEALIDSFMLVALLSPTLVYFCVQTNFIGHQGTKACGGKCSEKPGQEQFDP